ncbi:MAG TPA: hypothetical protein VM736_16410 [Gemmatimonadales bacterium]|nr:hypothetical protein [Gemmatimonadales bacterium]
MKHDAPLDDARLVQVARGLGERAADRLDVERAARGVVARWRAEPRHLAARPALIGIAPAWLRIAAALVLVVGGAVALGIWRGGARGLAAPTEIVDLSDLSAGELNELLSSVAETPGAEPVLPQDVGLDDLTASQLRVLLESLEA